MLATWTGRGWGGAFDAERDDARRPTVHVREFAIQVLGFSQENLHGFHALQVRDDTDGHGEHAGRVACRIHVGGRGFFKQASQAGSLPGNDGHAEPGRGDGRTI